jgi:hypothetical protein
MAVAAQQMIDLIIFEDRVTDFSEAISKEVPIPCSGILYGSDEIVDWHREWNALGDDAALLGRSSVKMDTNEAFDKALTWCLTTNARSIVICDYHFLGVTVQEEQVAQVGEAALIVTGKGTVAEATEYFNMEAHGLLLAAALAMNLNADVDVWLATSIHREPEVNRERLSVYLRATFWLGVAFDTVTKGVEGRAVESVGRAVRGYFQRRQLPDPGFWPDYAIEWFADNNPPTAHRHGQFVEHWRAGLLGERSLMNYLHSLGASNRVAEQWLSHAGCYETLKQFVGNCALVHASEDRDRQLFLGSLVFVLLKATAQGEGWTENFSWEGVPTRPILRHGREASKRLILACHQLFQRLYKSQNGLGTNEVRAKFEEKQASEGMHLLIDFKFDCSIGETVSKPSLLARLLALSQRPSSGDTTRAFSAVLDASLDENQDRQLFIALYPVEDKDAVWTRLDFKANS